MKQGRIDSTLFVKALETDLFIAHVYINDIVFGSTNSKFLKEFIILMEHEFEMSLVGKLNFFLGLQIKLKKKIMFACP